MSFATESLLFSLPLAQLEQVNNWLTPIWIMSLGVTVGFILAVLFYLLVMGLQRVSLFNRVDSNKPIHILLGVLTGLGLVGLFLAFVWWRSGPYFDITEMGFTLCFVTPFFLLLGYGFWALVSKRMIGEITEIAFEGFNRWVTFFCLALMAFTLAGFGLSQAGGVLGLKIVEEPIALMQSLGRLPYTGSTRQTFEIPPSGENTLGHPVEVNFSGQELQILTLKADTPLTVWEPPPLTSDGVERLPDPSHFIDVSGQNKSTDYFQRTDGRGRITHAFVQKLKVLNVSSKPATLELTWTIAPIDREVSIVPYIAFWTFLLFASYLMFAAVSPKVYAVALSTFKTEISQPLYMLVFAIGIVFMVASIYIPYNTFGEDIKMYKDSGLTLMRVLAIFLAIWAASKSVAEEIEGRTALTVLSKPVGRRQFVFGKFMGISLALGLLFIVLGFWLVTWVAYKPVYDFKEAAKGLCEWTVCYRESVHIIPGIVLCFMEVVIFVAISVAISTRMGIMANFLICFAVYILGHLTPRLVQSSEFAKVETIEVFSNLLSAIFPVADYFDVQTAINNSQTVAMEYMAWSVIYTLLYVTFAMLFALTMFEDRDLA